MASSTVVFITGANTGLGYEAAKALVKSADKYSVIIGSRSPDKGQAALSQLKAEVPATQSELSVVQIDIESDESIQNAYQSISSTFGRVDVLVNNAGGGFDGAMQDKSLSLREGWNKAWDLNVTGTQVLTSTMIPLLLKSSNPRLLFITSGTSALAETEQFHHPVLQRINGSPEAGWPKQDSVNPITSYRSSKTGLNMLMREWTRILRNDGVKVWAVSPGFLATGLGNVGVEKLKQMGARDPSVGGEFIRDVVEGKRDEDQGKAIRAGMIQPW